jgi:hypothetical protein
VACPQIEGTRVPDLLAFMKEHQLEDYLPGPNRNGKPLKYDRDWLLTVSQ